MASLISANSEAFLERTFVLIRQWFDELKHQEAGKGKFGRLETGPGAFGVVRRIGQDEGDFSLFNINLPHDFWERLCVPLL